jgi:hypothetical protein
MRWMAWGLLFASLVGCDEKTDEPKEEARTAEPEATTLAAAELCELVMGASMRNLQASCNAENKNGPAYAYIAGVADDRVKQCILVLKDDVGPGWATLPAERARACAAALEKRSWKDTLVGRTIAAEPACRDLIVGTQPEGQPCHRDAACRAGLVCVGAKTAAPGACKPPGPLCEARASVELGWLARSTCAAGQRCNVAAPPRRFPLGYDGALMPAIPLPTGEANSAREQALRDAVEFGMIGMLNAGDEQPLHRGLDRILRGLPPDDSEPTPHYGLGLSGIGGADHGVGSMGTIGGQRYGTGKGFGGTATPRPAPPKVRMGATSVSGRLPPEVIQRIVRQNFGRFRLCYENGLGTNPNLQGRVTVRFVIGQDGSVGSVSAGGDMPDSGVVSCVTRAFQSLRFPQPEGGIVTVSYPIVFSPGDDAKSKKPSPPAPDLEKAPDPETAASAESEAAPEAPPIGDLCVPAESCIHAGDCAPTETCVVGQCRRLGGNAAPCAESLDCELGLYCKRTGESSACAPREKAPAPCATSLACDGYCSKDGVCVDFCGARE